MAGPYYYAITALPALGHLGTEPPMSAGELVEHLARAPGPLGMVRALLLGDDLLQREALLAGEVEHVRPAVLTVPQARDEAPLPDFLQAAAEDRVRKIAADALWSAYYRYVDRVASDCGSPFLRGWVRHEVGLRNALAAARAKALQLEPADYLVNPEMGQDEEDFEATVGEWSAARDPIAGLRVLDTERWNWVSRNDAWFTFAQDELAAYAAKLVLLTRWQRLESARAEAREAPEPSA